MPANYVLLERIELNASAASVTFSNIPQTGYTDLKVVMSMRSADVSNIAFECSLTFNGNTTGYTAKQLFGDGSTAGSSSPTIRPAGFIVGTTATANTFSNNELYIPNYTSSNNKSYSVDSVTETNATTQYMNLLAGLWSNIAAITTIALAGTSGSFAANSTFSLYGLAAVGTTPAIAPKASGGNVIATDGTYWYHAFLSSGTFTPATALSCDVVGIGGGGGAHRGGAGAGGVTYITGKSFTVSASTVTIGAGGAGASGGNQGNNTTFASITSLGGGKSDGEGIAGSAGGSGGGGAGTGSTFAGGAATQGSSGGATGYGNAGGSGGNFYQGGGGGGAGNAGGNSVSGSKAGDGGAGLNTWSTWASTTGTGVSGYYAGGGGGYSESVTAGAAGAGGAGAGNRAGGAGFAATANTGSGGGGGGSAGGSGGSGIVIIRYTIA